MPRASAKAMPMKRVAVWPAAADGLRRAPARKLPATWPTDCGCAGTDCCQACADELTELCDIAFHDFSPYDGIGDLGSREGHLAHPDEGTILP